MFYRIMNFISTISAKFQLSFLLFIIPNFNIFVFSVFMCYYYINVINICVVNNGQALILYQIGIRYYKVCSNKVYIMQVPTVTKTDGFNPVNQIMDTKLVYGSFRLKAFTEHITRHLKDLVSYQNQSFYTRLAACGNWKFLKNPWSTSSCKYYFQNYLHDNLKKKYLQETLWCCYYNFIIR